MDCVPVLGWKILFLSAISITEVGELQRVVYTLLLKVLAEKAVLIMVGLGVSLSGRGTQRPRLNWASGIQTRQTLTMVER